MGAVVFMREGGRFFFVFLCSLPLRIMRVGVEAIGTYYYLLYYVHMYNINTCIKLYIRLYFILTRNETYIL